MVKPSRFWWIEPQPFQRAAYARQHIIQAIESEAEQLLSDSGGKVLRNHAGYLYEEYGNGGFPTLTVVWPPDTQLAYLAPIGQEDGLTIFCAALLPVSWAELHLTYDYRPVFLFGSFEEFFTLRVAEVRIFAEREEEDESQSS